MSGELLNSSQLGPEPENNAQLHKPATSTGGTDPDQVRFTTNGLNTTLPVNQSPYDTPAIFGNQLKTLVAEAKVSATTSPKNPQENGGNTTDPWHK